MTGSVFLFTGSINSLVSPVPFLVSFSFICYSHFLTGDSVLSLFLLVYLS